jgi:hypothetical protein
MDELKTYLVFLQNLKTGEEFVAPATAENQDNALLMIGDKYPPRLYKMQTVYTLDALERIVTDVKRWPGVASSVQPMVEQLQKRVVSGGALPPLPGQQGYAQPVAAAKPMLSAIEAIRAMSAGKPLGSTLETIKEAPLVASTPAPVETKPARPAMRTVAASIISRPAQPAVTNASVLDVLKALRN